jgi:hypothetical protein
MTKRDVIDGGNMDRAKAREWVAELLRQFTTRKDSVVVMANLDHLAERASPNLSQSCQHCPRTGSLPTL